MMLVTTCDASYYMWYFVFEIIVIVLCRCWINLKFCCCFQLCCCCERWCGWCWHHLKVFFLRCRFPELENSEATKTAGKRKLISWNFHETEITKNVPIKKIKPYDCYFSTANKNSLYHRKNFIRMHMTTQSHILLRQWSQILSVH